MEPTQQDLHLSERINEWKNKTIRIKKEQNKDIDEISMILENASFHDRPKSIDGYVSPLVLQLHGDGAVMTSTESSESIPNQTYDIPIAETYNMIFEQKKIKINTDDSSYTIYVQ